jgi:ANTAR domain
VVARAKLVLSARYGLLLDEAFEMLCALALSQRCSVEEFGESVVRSGGRLDGDPRPGSASSLGGMQNGSATVSPSAELLIEAPSAASAFLLAGELAEYGARAIAEGGVWRVVVDRCSSCSEGAPGALSRTRGWLAECGLATASVTLNGDTYLLDGSAAG